MEWAKEEKTRSLRETSRSPSKLETEKKRENASKKSFVEKSSIKYPITASFGSTALLQLPLEENENTPCESGRSTEENAACEESV